MFACQIMKNRKEILNMRLFKTKIHWCYFTIIIAVGFQLYSTACVPGITYDSNQYLASAESFASHKKLLHANGTPHIDHVPLYPVILSFLGNNRLQLSKYLNTLCLAGILFLFIDLSLRILNTTATKALFSLALVVSVPLQLIHHFVWSEPLFLFLLALILWYLHKYINQSNRQYFWIITGVSFLMCMQRNPGIFLVAGIALSLWVFTDTGFWRAMLYGALSVSGWVTWTIGGMQITKNGLHPAAYNIFGNILAKQNLDHYLNVISAWLMPRAIPLLIRGGLFLGLVFILIVWIKRLKLTLPGFAKALCTIAGVYIAFLQLTERISFHETQRYAAVVFPLLCLFFFQLYELLKQKLPEKGKLAVNIIFVLWLSYPLMRTAKNTRLWRNRACEPGYVEKQRSNPTMIFYNDNKLK